MEQAPDFELPDHEGRPWRLADHLEKPILVVFYRGDW
jgi:peroxiredoxin